MTFKDNLKALSTCMAVSILSVACSGPTAPPQAGPVPVAVETVHAQDAGYYDVYPATVVALNEVELRSEVNGFITNTNFQEGQTVAKGQKLYEIEQSKYAAAYAQAEANLNIALSNLEKVKNDAGRYERLGEQGMVTKQKLEYTQVDLENAKSQVAAAKAGLLRASTDLNHATITAPFSGTIGISLVKRGAYINAGQTLLNTISSDDPMAVDFVISEKELGRFLKLKEQKTAKADSLFTLVLPDKSLYPYTGTVELFDRAVDPQTATMKIRLRFPNPKHHLKAGMSANVRVQNKYGRKLPLIPNKAVTEQMGEFFVYVVANDTARQHKVTLGSPIKDRIVIQSGIQEGQQVVVEGVQKLKEGTPVQVGAAKAPNPALPNKK
ncbi:MAG TPA: efflux RND transporter periplasmic adaptor subunit [Cytophagales bacterium]|nr:efflux RND transporter periplasmic adaptor subunit [Cytophagales bacterium]